MFTFLYFVLTFGQIISARVGVLPCLSNEDCTDGYSCHNDICTKCFKCNLLLRDGSDCVTDFNECGECLPGYENVLITDSSNAVKPCKPVRLKEKLNAQECTDDSTCPQDYYCHEQFCVKCFNCSLVNRLLSVGNCPKFLSDCGPCVNGFEEVAVTLNTDFKLCERQTVTSAPEVPKVITFGNISSACMVVLVVIAVSAMSATIFFKKHKVKILTKSQCPELPSAPPFYVMDMPEHIKKLEEQESDVQLAIDYKQEAKVFKTPDALYYYRENEVPHTEPGSESSAQNHVPDMWAPTASSEPNGEMVAHPSGIFVNNYIERRGDISETDSAGQSREVSRSPIPVIELNDNHLRDLPIENVDSNNSHQ